MTQDEQLSHLFAIEYDNECMSREISKLRADKQVLMDALEFYADCEGQRHDSAREAIAKTKGEEG